MPVRNETSLEYFDRYMREHPEADDFDVASKLFPSYSLDELVEKVLYPGL